MVAGGVGFEPPVVSRRVAVLVVCVVPQQRFVAAAHAVVAYCHLVRADGYVRRRRPVVEEERSIPVGADILACLVAHRLQDEAVDSRLCPGDGGQFACLANQVLAAMPMAPSSGRHPPHLRALQSILFARFRGLPDLRRFGTTLRGTADALVMIRPPRAWGRAAPFGRSIRGTGGSVRQIPVASGARFFGLASSWEMQVLYRGRGQLAQPDLLLT